MSIDKYLGTFGTYSSKHHPLAIYAEAVNKTFWCIRNKICRQQTPFINDWKIRS